MWTPAICFPLLLPSFLPQTAPRQPRPLATRIDEVTVYRGSARVHRTSAVLPADGTYVVEGLTGALDRDNVRVRCSGGHAIDVEVRERHVREVPEERVQALRARVAAAARELQAKTDELEVQVELAADIEGLMAQEAQAHAREVEQGRAAPEIWRASASFLLARLGDNLRARRELGWEVAELRRARDDLQAELGRLQGAGGVLLHDVHVKVAVDDPAAHLELEYFVSGAGWTPDYDLRAARDARRVALTYRARVQQQTGEDWKDVRLLLSTAEPKKGAQGPDPRPIAVGLHEPRALYARVSAGLAAEAAPAEDRDEIESLGRAEKDAPAAPPPFAEVHDEGLSARFEVAGLDTVESREAPATVLVGEAAFDVRPEYACVPALDQTVWLRGIATNTSDWTLLPGSGSVFFGQDYLGRARIEAVPPGAELTLHLGAAPAISVERVQTEDMRKGPGFLGSDRSQVESWRNHFENHGAMVCDPDGSVTVVVREAVPRSTDERVEVDLKEMSQPSSDAERWKADRLEQGIHTWLVRVPRDGEADLSWRVEIRFPKGMAVRIRQEGTR